MKFYRFHQNNSFGRDLLDKDRGIGRVVWIEAENVDDANMNAERLGIYFDGISKDIDCPCCGDRWTPASDWDSADDPKEDFWSPVYIHYNDGRFEQLN